MWIAIVVQEWKLLKYLPQHRRLGTHLCEAGFSMKFQGGCPSDLEQLLANGHPVSRPPNMF
jgi:hypothetical protein